MKKLTGVTITYFIFQLTVRVQGATITLRELPMVPPGMMSGMLGIWETWPLQPLALKKVSENF